MLVSLKVDGEIIPLGMSLEATFHQSIFAIGIALNVEDGIFNIGWSQLAYLTHLLALVDIFQSNSIKRKIQSCICVQD